MDNDLREFWLREATFAPVYAVIASGSNLKTPFSAPATALEHQARSALLSGMVDLVRQGYLDERLAIISDNGTFDLPFIRAWNSVASVGGKMADLNDCQWVASMLLDGFIADGETELYRQRGNEVERAEAFLRSLADHMQRGSFGSFRRDSACLTCSRSGISFEFELEEWHCAVNMRDPNTNEFVATDLFDPSAFLPAVRWADTDIVAADSSALAELADISDLKPRPGFHETDLGRKMLTIRAAYHYNMLQTPVPLRSWLVQDGGVTISSRLKEAKTDTEIVLLPSSRGWVSFIERSALEAMVARSSKCELSAASGVVADFLSDPSVAILVKMVPGDRILHHDGSEVQLCDPRTTPALPEAALPL